MQRARAARSHENPKDVGLPAGVYEDFVSEVAADYIQDVAGNGDFADYLERSAHAHLHLISTSLSTLMHEGL